MSIFQKTIPYDVTARRPLPSIAALDMSTWLHVDDAFADQMALRVQLIDTQRDKVIAQTPQAHEAMSELLDYVVSWLKAHSPDYAFEGQTVTRPDGQVMILDRGDPLATLGGLIQEDLCVMQKIGSEHVLTAAVLCFPASWRLAEKIGKPLVQIHAPVDEYGPDLARRVQRLFDGVQPDRPLWRFNVLHYEEAALFQPRSVTLPRALEEGSDFPYLRSERQCILRLPLSQACVFSIHTYVALR